MINELGRNPTKVENCKPYKTIKEHFKSLINNLELLKKRINSKIENIITIDLIFMISKLEKMIIELQKEKYKYYFINFKNCTSCKSL